MEGPGGKAEAVPLIGRRMQKSKGKIRLVGREGDQDWRKQVPDNTQHSKTTTEQKKISTERLRREERALRHCLSVHPHLITRTCWGRASQWREREPWTCRGPSCASSPWHCRE